jgi:hypothetical protein
MVWSQLAEINTPPVVTTDFLYLRFIGDRSIQEKDFGRIQIDRVLEMQKWAGNIKNVQEEQRVKLAIAAANNHYAGFGPGTVNIFRNLLGLPEAKWQEKEEEQEQKQQQEQEQQEAERVISVMTHRRGDSELVVSITDNGKGIDPEVMPRLFTKFATRSFDGTGLGLFIAKSIVEAHGGKIWAQNNSDGKGATFSFSLPLLSH